MTTTQNLKYLIKFRDDAMRAQASPFSRMLSKGLASTDPDFYDPLMEADIFKLTLQIQKLQKEIRAKC